MNNRDLKRAAAFLVIVLLIVVIGVVAKTILGVLDNVEQGNIEISKTPDPLKAELSNAISRYKNGNLKVIDISVATPFS
jgi:hypothetical protein